MEILTLKRPDISFSDEIRSYRQEFLDAGSPLNGCGPLADMEDPAEWVAHTVRFEKGDDIPEDMVPSTQFMSESPTAKSSAPSRSATPLLHFWKHTADISATPSVQANVVRDTQSRCFTTVFHTAKNSDWKR